MINELVNDISSALSNFYTHPPVRGGPPNIDEIIDNVAKKYGVPPDKLKEIVAGNMTQLTTLISAYYTSRGNPAAQEGFSEGIQTAKQKAIELAYEMFGKPKPLTVQDVAEMATDIWKAKGSYWWVRDWTPKDKWAQTAMEEIATKYHVPVEKVWELYKELNMEKWGPTLN
jgi:CO/xanthine dehydrogenase Mo-binding subunit